MGESIQLWASTSVSSEVYKVVQWNVCVVFTVINLCEMISYPQQINHTELKQHFSHRGTRRSVCLTLASGNTNILGL